MDRIIEEGYANEIFVVQEKIHGANFSFWLTENDFRTAKRTGFIKENEKFYNSDIIVIDLQERLRILFELLQDTHKAEEVVVYGELYGGNYPHDNVPVVNVKSVQKGVYYTPEQEFIGFDITVNGLYLNVSKVNSLFDRFGIPFSETLFMGSLEDCLKHSNEFQSTIPALKGLPEIKNNICEGVVIRPLKPLFLWSKERLIIKNKNEKFSEKTGANGERKTKEVKSLSPGAQQALDKVGEYITDNRLRNVVSKVGEVTNKDFGKIMGLFTQDVIEDYLKDEKEFFNTLEKSDRKLVTKKVGQAAALLLRQNFMNVIDGEF